MPKTYEPIASTTIVSASTVTFSSIPQTYTDLVIVVDGTSSGYAQTALKFNGATTNYRTALVSADGTSRNGFVFTANPYLQLGYYDLFFTSPQASSITHIMSYTNSNIYKTCISRTNNTTFGLGLSVGVWSSTAAITEVEVLPAASTWATGAIITLYGIKAA
jgi:hypothetical protein